MVVTREVILPPGYFWIAGEFWDRAHFSLIETRREVYITFFTCTRNDYPVYHEWVGGGMMVLAYAGYYDADASPGGYYDRCKVIMQWGDGSPRHTIDNLTMRCILETLLQSGGRLAADNPGGNDGPG